MPADVHAVVEGTFLSMFIHLPQGDLQDLGGLLCKGLSSVLVISQNQIHRCRQQQGGTPLLLNSSAGLPASGA